MRTICAWCRRVRSVRAIPATHPGNGPDYVVEWLFEKPGELAGQAGSHGICPSCQAIHFPEPPAAAPVPAEVH